jgi:predicted nuclease of predicted toxin-antitoxin system
MRLLLDESVEYRILLALEEAGHDVTAISRDYPSSLTDESVLAIADRERRILITNDLDFGALVFRDKRRHRGVILLRHRRGSTRAKSVRLQKALTDLTATSTHFVVIEPTRIRVRRRRQ